MPTSKKKIGDSSASTPGRSGRARGGSGGHRGPHGATRDQAKPQTSPSGRRVPPAWLRGHPDHPRVHTSSPRVARRAANSGRILNMFEISPSWPAATLRSPSSPRSAPDYYERRELPPSNPRVTRISNSGATRGLSDHPISQIPQFTISSIIRTCQSI